MKNSWVDKKSLEAEIKKNNDHLEEMWKDERNLMRIEKLEHDLNAQINIALREFSSCNWNFIQSFLWRYKGVSEVQALNIARKVLKEAIDLYIKKEWSNVKTFGNDWKGNSGATANCDEGFRAICVREELALEFVLK